MAENTHDQQLGKFVLLFQGLESALIELFGITADEDYPAAILPAETKYRRLDGSPGLAFFHFVYQLRQPDVETKARFHELMERCQDIGVFRDRLVHSKYALLIRTGEAVGKAQSAESFGPYFRKIAGALAELEFLKLRVVEWKHPKG